MGGAHFIPKARLVSKTGARFHICMLSASSCLLEYFFPDRGTYLLSSYNRSPGFHPDTISAREMIELCSIKVTR